jgi:hypothetical protein
MHVCQLCRGLAGSVLAVSVLLYIAHLLTRMLGVCPQLLWMRKKCLRRCRRG